MFEPNKQNESDDKQNIPNNQNSSSSQDFDTDPGPAPSTGPDPDRRRRRPRREPPSLDVLQRSLARSMAQIIVNMTNTEYQRTSLELLQITDLDDVQHRILYMVQENDAKQEQQQQQQQRNRRQQ